jgi:hypothetical protein
MIVYLCTAVFGLGIFCIYFLNSSEIPLFKWAVCYIFIIFCIDIL